MPDVAAGVWELRVRDVHGIYRGFYYVASVQGVFVFHAFETKSQATSVAEIRLAGKRLKVML